MSNVEDGTVPIQRTGVVWSPGRAFRAIVTDGPDKGATLDVDGTKPSRIFVGQSEACDLKLTDRQVSRRHAALDITEHGLRYVDLESKNGTFLGSTRVTDVTLTGGESLRIGKTLLTFERQSTAQTIDLGNDSAFGKVLGKSAAMRRLYPSMRRLADLTVPVVIEGETGTGKEVLAESLHEQGKRAGGAFVVFDARSARPNEAEAILFGTARDRGLIEQADGGTLFLDEVGDLDISLQSKLLRVIEGGELSKGASEAPVHVDVRIIAGTRRDLDRLVQAGRFRDDLYYRLAVARLELPPLRKREADVQLLAERFYLELGGEGALPRDFLERHQDYAWPGNVRELRNAVTRFVTLGDLPAETIASGADAAASLPGGDDAIGFVLSRGFTFSRARQLVIEIFERRFVEHALAKHGGNVARAAAASGIARRYFQLIRAKQRAAGDKP